MNNLEYLKERTFFEDYVHIETGQVLTLDEFDTVVDSEGNPIPENKYVLVKFDENSLNILRQYLKKLLANRMIKEPEKISKNTPDVRRLVKEYELNYKRENKTKVVPTDVMSRFESEALAFVYEENETYYNVTLVQVLNYIILRNLFFMNRDGHLECKIEDVEVKEKFFFTKEDSNLTDVDNFLLDTKINDKVSVTIDRTNKLEIVTNITMSFLEDYKNFSEVFSSYITRVLAYLGNVDKVDQEEMFFRNGLDEFLS